MAGLEGLLCQRQALPFKDRSPLFVQAHRLRHRPLVPAFRHLRPVINTAAEILPQRPAFALRVLATLLPETSNSPTGFILTWDQASPMFKLEPLFSAFA